MQYVAPSNAVPERSRDADEQQALLASSNEEQRTGVYSWWQLAPSCSSRKYRDVTARLDAKAVADIGRLIACAHIWPALSIVALALLETLAVSKAGKHLSEFYEIFVDRAADRFVSTLAISIAEWGIVCLVSSSSFFVGQMLIIRWRRRIASSLQAHYCHDGTFHRLTVLTHQCITTDAPQQQDMAAECIDEAPANAAKPMPQPQAPDNPDQRMTDDVALACKSLEQVCQQCAKAPFTLVYFSYLALQVFGSVTPLLMALAYFCGCAVLHRLAASAIAGATFAQARAEGNFRSAHMRVRSCAQQIATWGGYGVEERALAASLKSTLQTQCRLACVLTAQSLIKNVRT